MRPSRALCIYIDGVTILGLKGVGGFPKIHRLQWKNRGPAIEQH
jgi:hypothetical protein